MMGLSKCSIDLSEVTALILECPKCGCSVSYPVHIEPRSAYEERCHHCGHGAQDRTQQEIMGNFRAGFADLVRHYESSPFKIRLEIKSDG